MRSRFTPEEEPPIHRIKKDVADESVDKPTTEAYTWGGQTVAVESPAALAKKVYNPISGTTQYWVKKYRGQLYNPQAQLSKAPLEKFEWAKSNTEQFQNYLSYIKPPHDNMFIRRAERS